MFSIQATTYSVPGTGNEATTYSVPGTGNEATTYSVTGNEATTYSVPGTGNEATTYSVPGTGNEATMYSVPGTGMRPLHTVFKTLIRVSYRGGALEFPPSPPEILKLSMVTIVVPSILAI